MLLNVASIVANVLFFLIMNMQIYTDRAKMPNGETRTWRRSPISRLSISGRTWLVWLQFVFAVLSVVTCILVMCGVKTRVIRIVQTAATVGSAIMFIAVMIVSGDTHVNYA